MPHSSVLHAMPGSGGNADVVLLSLLPPDGMAVSQLEAKEANLASRVN